MSTKSAKSTARDVFLYLLMIIVFISSIVSFITLVFNYVDVQMPAAFDWHYGQTDAIRGAIATLVIMWPVTMLSAWFVGKDLKQNKEKQGIWVRKWLLHLLLFLSSLTMIITLVTLVGTFLDGELTLRFAIKVLTVLTVAGLVFGYELWDLKRDVTEETNRPRLFAILGTVAVLGMIVASLFVIETPAEQRGMRFDEERIEDLSQIQSEIVSYLQEKEQLPETLADLDWGPVREMPIDPEMGLEYQYEVRGEYTFALCATFTGEDGDDQYYGRAYIEPLELEMKDDYESLNDWSHPAGSYCFERELSEDWISDVEHVE